jgi:hypothetical protein
VLSKTEKFLRAAPQQIARFGGIHCLTCGIMVNAARQSIGSAARRASWLVVLDPRRANLSCEALLHFPVVPLPATARRTYQ